MKERNKEKDKTFWAPLLKGAFSFYGYSFYWYLIFLFLLCLISRLITTVYYPEDPDSLRFALAVKDFNISELRPHFPGYPVFIFLIKFFTLILGKFSIAFSITGGLSVFLIIYASLKITHASPKSLLWWMLAALIFFNPLIWLMSNRYMSDLTGTAMVMIIFWGFKESLGSKRSWVLVTQFSVGLLAGIRISYLPVILLPSIYLLFKKEKKAQQLFTGIAGILIWLIPMIIDTGWDTLIFTAREQTTGHFYEWGGTVLSENSLINRFVKLIHSIWAAGLGGWWPERHWITLITGGGFFIAFLGNVIKKEKTEFTHFRIITLISIAIYLIWILFFQNVIHKIRHILPVVPWLLIFFAYGFTTLIHRKRELFIITFSMFMISYVILTGKLVIQHKQPTAIAQVKRYLLSQPGPKTVISIPLINFYLSAQGVKANFQATTKTNTLSNPFNKRNPANTLYRIGQGYTKMENSNIEKFVFYHNPYVNPVWPKIEVIKQRAVEQH